MRTSILRLTFFAVVALCALGGFWVLQERDAEDPLERSPQWLAKVDLENRPNILLVVYDTRRRDDFSIGEFGNTRNDTPFLNSFKDDAVFFDGAISPGTWTVPVHASMFSGLSVFDLSIDSHNESFNSFSSEFLSLAEILSLAGYRTIAYADHPYFFNATYRKGKFKTAGIHQELENSLIRGFEQFSVIRDFTDGFGAYTNIDSEDNRVELRFPLKGAATISDDEVDDRIDRFNSGDLVFDLRAEGDFDSENDLYWAKLDDLFEQSEYFQSRYGKDFDDSVFNNLRGAPYFLFVNLHMGTIAKPDGELWQRWVLKTILLNAQAKGVKVVERKKKDSGFRAWATGAIRVLGLHAKLGEKLYYPQWVIFKHVFDNRFYDKTFEALWKYLDQKDFTSNTLTIVTSDHGLSFSEHGETLYAHNGARPTESLVRVPLIIRLPESFPPMDGEYKQRVSLTDIFATIIEVALGEGVFARALPIRGKSLIDRLVNDDFARVIVSESALRAIPYDVLTGVSGDATAVYLDDLKLIVAPELYEVSKGWKNNAPLPEEKRRTGSLSLLYNLADDPYERLNLATKRPDLVEKLSRELTKREKYKLHTTPSLDVKMEDSRLNTLRALGYIE